MEEINIYIHTTGTHSFMQDIAGSYVVEYVKDGIPHTYPPEGKTTMEFQNKCTPERLTINLMTRAVNTARWYLDYSQGVKHITVYMDSTAIRAFVCDWPKKWEENGYKTAHGTEIKNKEAWQRYNEYIHKLDDISIIFTSEPDSYQSLMISQALEELKKHQSTE